MSIADKRLQALSVRTDEQIDYSDIPELGDDFFKNAEAAAPEGTQQITLRVKTSVLEAYKATGKGYHTRMNAALESFVETLRT